MRYGDGLIVSLIVRHGDGLIVSLVIVSPTSPPRTSLAVPARQAVELLALGWNTARVRGGWWGRGKRTEVEARSFF